MGDILFIYTQNNCPFCDILKQKLDTYALPYVTINISEDDGAGKEYLRDMGHKTVPQLYYRNYHLNDIPTVDITEDYLKEKIGESI